jgi:hypothetical protein
MICAHGLGRESLLDFDAEIRDFAGTTATQHLSAAKKTFVKSTHQAQARRAGEISFDDVLID